MDQGFMSNRCWWRGDRLDGVGVALGGVGVDMGEVGIDVP